MAGISPHFALPCAGSFFASLRQGERRTMPGDLVSSAPELARLTLNLAAIHHDASAAADGRRLVYGGHTVGIAAPRRAAPFRRCWPSSAGIPATISDRCAKATHCARAGDRTARAARLWRPGACRRVGDCRSRIGPGEGAGLAVRRSLCLRPAVSARVTRSRPRLFSDVTHDNRSSVLNPSANLVVCRAMLLHSNYLQLRQDKGIGRI